MGSLWKIEWIFRRFQRASDYLLKAIIFQFHWKHARETFQRGTQSRERKLESRARGGGEGERKPTCFSFPRKSLGPGVFLGETIICYRRKRARLHGIVSRIDSPASSLDRERVLWSIEAKSSDPSAVLRPISFLPPGRRFHTRNANVCLSLTIDFWQISPSQAYILYARACVSQSVSDRKSRSRTSVFLRENGNGNMYVSLGFSVHRGQCFVDVCCVTGRRVECTAVFRDTAAKERFILDLSRRG